MAKETYRFLLRLPPALRERLVEAAERSGRSLNAELVHRIEQSFDPWRRVRRLAAPGLAAAAIALSGATGFVAVSAYPARAERSSGQTSSACAQPSRSAAPGRPLCALGSVVARDSAWTGA